MSVEHLTLLTACGFFVHAVHAATFSGRRRRIASPHPVDRLLTEESPALPRPGSWDGDCAVDAEGRSFATALPTEEHHAVRLRRLVREHLRVWQLEYLAHDAALVTHELFANAVEHGSTDPRDVIIVELHQVGHVLLIAVTDHVPGRAPEPKAAGDEEERGRGMEIIDCLATS